MDQTIREFNYVVVVYGNFSNFGPTILSKNKTSQITKESFEKIFLISTRKQNLIETDDGKNLVGRHFLDFLKKDKNEKYSRYTSLGAVFAERFKRTIKDFSRKPVSLKEDGNRTDILHPIMKKKLKYTLHLS